MEADLTLNLSTIAKQYQDEGGAYKLVESLRWPTGPVCPHCGVIDHAYFLEPKGERPRTTRTGKVSARRVWKCGDCHKKFSVLVGTIFEDSKIPLSKWLLALHLMCAGKNGVAAYELHRILGITSKSAWFMAHRIRYAMEHGDFGSPLQGTVEADETYIGGKAKNMHARQRRERITGTGGTDKTPVFSLVQRGGEVRSQVMPSVTSKNIREVLIANVDKSARLMTDSLNVYTGPGREFAAHEVVDHGRGEYVRGDAHSNTVEGFFSQLKRSIDGTHHHVSAQHLGRYVAEFDYRYSSRKLTDSERTVKAIQQTTGKRLRYG